MKRTAALGVLILAIVLLGLVMTSSAQDFGSNWTGQYFNDVNFTTTCGTRVDAQVNFNFGTGGPTGAPLTCTAVDNFSIRWTGVQTFAVAGIYNFTAFADDAIVVTIDGTTIISSPGAMSTPMTVAVSLNAGAHTIQVNYQEFNLTALVQLQWILQGAGATASPFGPTATPGPTNTPVPTSLPPIPPGAITATVIRASVLNIRDAPSLGGNRINRVLRGQTYAIVGRNQNATWFLLQLSGMQGWAWGYYLFINGNEFNPPVVSGSSILGLAGQPDYGVTAQSKATVRLRAAPNVVSAQIGRVTWGAFLPVIGRTPDGFWWKVVWKNTVGWVYSPFFDIFQGNLNNVPIVTQ
jgi:hypothetical protein